MTNDQVLIDLNTDVSSKGMATPEIQAIVAAWQSGAISRYTLLHNFRTGEILPPARGNGRAIAETAKKPGKRD